MRAVVQRVSKASVAVGDEEVGRIGSGLLVFLGVSSSDGEEEARYIADKTINLRIFPDDKGRFDRSALDIGAPVLVVSQFTLYGDTRRGRRPSFTGAAPPEQASSLVERTVALLAGAGGGLALATAGGIPAALALPLNLGVALATTAGDLLESLLKRQWQADDSGSLLPGHGGLLDRMDGTLLAAPVLWLLLQIL